MEPGELHPGIEPAGPSVVAPLRTQLGDCFDHHDAAAVEIAQQHVELASVNSAREAAL
jgi:hypothetical protein